MASANNQFKSHEEYRRAKELEEARKAGIAPAAVDEEGKEINPHIPQYMSSAPWYLNNDRPSLKHQKDWRQQAQNNKTVERGIKVFQATKFRKGACENCGAMSHTTKDCMDRPRVKGAKWTNKNIAADEKVEEVQLGFEAKRDRWNGYDTGEYTRVMDMYEKVDQAKRAIRKEQALQDRFKEGPDAAEGSGDSDLDDEDKIMESEEAGFGKLEKRVRTTGGGASGSVRNLRIREDTAKYLLNLDANSAHYDPKSRSMREDPQPNKPDNQKTFAGDNFVRKNGDYHAWEQLSLHSYTAYDKGQDIHAQAAPSQAEALFQQFKAKKEKLQVKTKEQIMEQYGNAAAAEKPPEELLLGQTERYVEYDASGRVIKGVETKARSRYEEDVLINNHTAVWGSWWSDGVWGFACCHQTSKNSYCIGEAGKQAAIDVEAQLTHNMEVKERERAAQAAQAAAAGDVPRLEGFKGNSAVWGSETDESVQLDKAKLAAALAKAEASAAAEVEVDERKRKYNSLRDADNAPTAEEMEAYRMKRAREDDPLANLKPGDAGANGYDYV